MIQKLNVSFHGTGIPIVVIETGMGCSWYDWYKIIDEISKTTTVLTYHRSGYGKSTFGSEKRSTKQIAEDLNELIESERINSQIILVGHSFGGLCVQHFASLFSKKVAGMVLIDSNSVDEYKMDELKSKLPSFKKIFSKEKIVEDWRALSLKNKAQLEILIFAKPLPEQLEFPDEIQKSIVEFELNPNIYATMASELELMSLSGQEAKKCFKLLDIPLKVLGRDMEIAVKWNVNMGIPENEAKEFEMIWNTLVREEVKNSTRGEFIEVLGSKHSIYRTNPEVVVKAIHDVINESRINRG